MSDQEINVAIAEACGWKWEIRRSYRETPGWYSPADHGPEELPNYCTDLNAMHEAEVLISKSSRPWSSGPNHEPMQFLHHLATTCGVKTREELVLHVPDDLHAEFIARMKKGPPLTLPVGCTVLGHHIPCTGWELEIIRATARQRAEAFLKTLGKWREG